MNKRIRPIRFFISFFSVIILQSCATTPVQPPRHPLSDQRVTDILNTVEKQENAVHSFFSSSRIVLRGCGSEFEANVLVVATRNPLKMKLEVTHFWGRPLFHILINGTRIQILSFPEKRYYLGDVRAPLPSNLLPMRFDTDQLWAVTRGFPVLSRYNRKVLTRQNQISLLDSKGAVIQLIDFYSDRSLFFQVFYPGQALQLSFCNFTNENDIQYARKTRLSDQKNKTMMVLNTKRIVFNTSIDDSIFDLTVPPDFECIRNDHPFDTQ